MHNSFFLIFPVSTDCQYNGQPEMSVIQCYVVSCLWLFTACTIHQISWNWSGPSCCLHCCSSYSASWLWHICGKLWCCIVLFVFPLAQGLLIRYQFSYALSISGIVKVVSHNFGDRKVTWLQTAKSLLISLPADVLWGSFVTHSLRNEATYVDQYVRKFLLLRASCIMLDL